MGLPLNEYYTLFTIRAQVWAILTNKSDENICACSLLTSQLRANMNICCNEWSDKMCKAVKLGGDISDTIPIEFTTEFLSNIKESYETVNAFISEQIKLNCIINDVEIVDNYICIIGTANKRRIQYSIKLHKVDKFH